jgi:hypothetical protein
MRCRTMSDNATLARDDGALECSVNAVGAGKAPRTQSTWLGDQGYCCWLVDDPRSASAMLRGRGDGREILYAHFVQAWQRRDPLLSVETLDARYAETTLTMDAQIAEALGTKDQLDVTAGTAVVLRRAIESSLVIVMPPIGVAVWVARRARRILALMILHWVARY